MNKVLRVSGARPCRFYLLQLVRDTYDELDGAAKVVVDAMLESCGMADLFSIRLSRRLAQVDNLEVSI